MLPILYGQRTGYEYIQSLDTQITSVRLELIRVREQNNTKQLKGILIPVWTFYGTSVVTDKEGYSSYSNYGMGGGNDYYQGDQILLCINAIDGTVIDPLLGRTEGVFGEPAGVTATAGVKRAVEEGIIRPDETVTVISTGSGLKDVNNALRAAGEPFLCEPDIRVLEQSGRIR